MNIFQMLMQNPQQIINKALGNNPMAGNLVNLVNNKDSKGIEQMARNLAKEKGVDADKMYQQIKNQLGL
jgi:hypothetical protein